MGIWDGVVYSAFPGLGVRAVGSLFDSQTQLIEIMMESRFSPVGIFLLSESSD